MGLSKRAQPQRTMDTNAQKELGGNTMEDVVITEEMVKKQAKKMKNWTAPGKDEVHGFWIAHLTSLHPKIAQQLNRLLETATIEEWLSTGNIILMKNKKAGAIPSNYRPIICLYTTFKLMTAIIANAIQNHLYNFIPEEQKGNRRNSQGTKDQLLIDKMILRNTRRRKTNLHVAWIDYKKAFDSLPHSWVAKCLEIKDSINSQWASTLLRPHQKRDLPRRFNEPTALRNSHDSHDNNTQADRIRIPNFQVSSKDFPPTLHG